MSSSLNSIQKKISLLEHSNKQEQLEAIASLENIADAKVARALISTVAHNDFEVSNAALDALYKIADSWLVAHIVEVISTIDDEHIADKFVPLLTEIGKNSKLGLAELVKVSNHKNSLVRAEIVHVLGIIGDKQALDVLIKSLSDEDNDVRLYSTKALGRLEDSRAINPLIKLIQEDKDNLVRLNAAKSLSRLEAIEAIPSLIGVLKELDTDVLNEPERSQVHLRIVVGETLAGFGAPAVTPLLAVIEHEDSPSIELALSYVSDEKASEPLLEAIEYGNSNVRLLAIRTLKQIGFDTRAIEPLIQALSDPDESVRYRAAFGLRYIGARFDNDENNPLRQAIEPLTKLLDDPDKDVRCAALNALSQIADKSLLEIFHKALNDEKLEVRGLAVQTLGYIGDKSSLPYLTKLRLNTKGDSMSKLVENALVEIH